jgi:hypothetical protein
MQYNPFKVDVATEEPIPISRLLLTLRKMERMADTADKLEQVKALLEELVLLYRMDRSPEKKPHASTLPSS